MLSVQHRAGTQRRVLTGNSRLKNPASRSNPCRRDDHACPRPYALCTDHIGKSYSFPRSLTEIKIRLDTNVFNYLGNYLLVILGVLVCVMYNRPTALVGGVVTMKMWDWVRSGAAIQGSTMYQFKYGAATILSWAVMMYCNVTLAVVNAILIGTTVARAVLSAHATSHIVHRV